MYHSEKIDPEPRSNKDVDIALASIEYKIFLLENMKYSILVNTIKMAIDAIDSSSEINNVYSTAAFAMEARQLEENFSELNKQMDVLPIFDSLLSRMDTFSKHNTLSDVDHKVFVLLYATVVSKMSSIRSEHKSDTIIDIVNYLDLTIQNIAKFDENNRIRVIQEQRNQYNDGLTAKIHEVDDCIENYIQPEIETVFVALNMDMQKLVDETIAWQRRTLNDIQWKEEKAILIRRNIMNQRIISMVKFVTNIFSFVGSIFEETFTSAFNSIDIDTNVIDSNKEQNEIKSLPLSIQRLRNEMQKNDYEIVVALESETMKLMNSLEIMHFTNNRLSDWLSHLTSNISVTKLRKSSQSHAISQLINEQIAFLNNWHSQNVPDEIPEQVGYLVQRTANALNVIASSVSSYQKFGNDDQSIDEIAKATNDDRETLTAFLRFENDIYSELIPMVDALQEEIDNIERNIANKSSVALNMVRWKFLNIFHKVRKKLGDAVSRFDVTSSIKESLVRIGEAINLIINIFDRIQQYQDDSKLANYLADLQLANYEYLDVKPQTQEDIIELKHYLHANLILSQCYRAINAFKQAMFPYAVDYLDIYGFPNDFNTKNFDDIIAIATNKMISLKERITVYNSTVINGNDMFTHLAHFDNDHNSRGPFYVWKNAEVRNKIEQLFDGEKIYFDADIMKSDTRNAVKFNVIDLKFNSNNQTIDDQLNKVLQQFQVSLTHMGESDYGCNNVFYTISSDPLTIEFNFTEKNRPPTDRNIAYDKLMNGIKMLSPYTLWTIQLSTGSFQRLKPFAGLVDIELHGHGQYVKENATICNKI